MLRILLLSGLVFLLGMLPAYSVPNLQLFAEGATYDTEEESWITPSSTLDLCVIGANSVASVDVDGMTYDNWAYGYTPIMTAATWDPGDDLAGHSIFPGWFTEFSAGDFGVAGGVGNAMPVPTYWNLSNEGHLAGSKTLDQYRVFGIGVTGTTFLHFDDCTVNTCGGIRYFTPSSHDDSLIPEPGTIILFGFGAIGLGLYRRFKK
jgi:hypothetical protein